MDKNNLKSKGFGSKEIASAAIKIALTSQREEEKMYQAEFLDRVLEQLLQILVVSLLPHLPK